MKYVKMLGLLAVAAAALMAFAGVASAASLTSPEGTTPTINASSEGTTTLHGVTNIECGESAVTGKVTSHGGATVNIDISSLTFGKCNHHVTVENGGSLSISSTATTGNGTVSSTDTRIRVTITSLGLSCVYQTTNTHIGTLTGGSGATLHIESAIVPRDGGSKFCGSSGEWTGSYKVTSPSSLSVH